MEAFERFDHAGFVCELHTDEDPGSPADWDTLGTLVAFPAMARSWGYPDRESTGTEDDALERGGFALVARYLRFTEGAIAVPFQLRDYGSGGARILVVDDDDDPSGFIVTTPARVTELAGEEHAHDHEWIRKALRSELREWDAYVAGEVIGFVVRDEAGEVVDSCWGFYPEHFTAAEREQYGRPASDDGLEYVRDEARAAAQWEAESRAATAEVERVERERAANMDVATVAS